MYFLVPEFFFYILCHGLVKSHSVEPYLNVVSEEKFLETEVRLEVKLDSIKAKLEDLEGNIRQEDCGHNGNQDVLKQLVQGIRALKDDDTCDLQEVRASLETRQTEMEKQLDGLLTTVESQATRMSQFIDADDCNTATQAVAFRATTVRNKYPALGEHLVFTSVDMNLGGGYDVTSGQFTAPVAGVYMFNLQLCTRSSSSIYFNLVTDAAKILRVTPVAFGNNKDAAACLSDTAIVSLNKDDVITVKCTNTGAGGGLFEDTHRQNSFSGALIQQHD